MCTHLLSAGTPAQPVAAALVCRGTYFARVVVSRRTPLVGCLQLPQGVPALLVCREGSVLGKAHISQFGAHDIWEEEVSWHGGPGAAVERQVHAGGSECSEQRATAWSQSALTWQWQGYACQPLCFTCTSLPLTAGDGLPAALQGAVERRA